MGVMGIMGIILYALYALGLLDVKLRLWRNTIFIVNFQFSIFDCIFVG